jgi:hypothetical protein
VVAAVVILALVVVVAMMVRGKSKGSAAVSAPTPAAQVAAVKPLAPPGATGYGAALGQPPDAGSPLAKPPAVGLGPADGTTAPGGATSGVKPAAAKKATPVVKKKPASKHPAKHKK